MPSTTHRTFTLMDAMSLVAATAVALAGFRCYAGDLGELRVQLSESLTAVAAPPDGWPSWGWAIWSSYGLLVTVLVPFCWAWTLAILGLRLRRPRSRLRRLMRQPGAIACYSAAFALVPALAGLLGLGVISGLLSGSDYASPQWDRLLGFSFILVPALTGFAILGSWATLLLGRRWRAEPDWIDRAGRLLGVYWIGAIFLPIWGLG
ncbi:MAG: hypothetical protein ACHRXM_27665 [Isosphaerales bacterium]